MLFKRDLLQSLVIIVFFISYLIAFVSSSSSKPNIILIIADDLGWNDVGFHGSAEIPTPNIDALAYNGLIMNRHYVLPTCTPSRVSLMTGKYPIRVGLQGDPMRSQDRVALPIEEKILPQYLKEQGYKTHLVGKWHLGFYQTRFTPTKRGFDSHFGFYSGTTRYNDSVTYSEPYEGIDAHRDLSPAGAEFYRKYLTDVFTEEAVRIIKNHDRNHPLFLEISHAAVHAIKNNILQVRNVDENNRKFGYIKNEHRRLFAGILDALDESVGKVIEALDSSQLLKNSVVLFISDNGGATVDPLWKYENTASNWPLRGMKTSLYEGGVRGVAALWSPLLIHRNNVTEEIFHISDWLPTFVAAAGGNVENIRGIDGVNQWNFLNGQQRTSNRSEVLININHKKKNAAIINGKWKLMRCHLGHTPSFADEYGGLSERNESEVIFKIEKVIGSTTNNVISKYVSSSLNLSETFLRVRSLATIDKKCSERILAANETRTTPCEGDHLFNVEDDPCEYYIIKNISYSSIANELKSRLDYFESVTVKQENIISDWKADPKFFSGYWKPWLDEEEKFLNCATLFNLSCIAIITILLYKII
ncbi:hypothetical protein PGB90_006895 [Kerria lacca]